MKATLYKAPNGKQEVVDITRIYALHSLVDFNDIPKEAFV